MGGAKKNHRQAFLIAAVLVGAAYSASATVACGSSTNPESKCFGMRIPGQGDLAVHHRC